MAIALLALAPAGAHASTASVVQHRVPNAEDCPSSNLHCTYAVVQFVGAAGEANQVDIAPAGPERTYRVRDDGADLTPGPGCEAQGARAVRCTVPAEAQYTEIHASLGDMNDTASVSAPVPDVLRGDAGDDTLTGNDYVNYMNGGPGKDKLVGGSGPDFLNGGSGTDPDVFDGRDGTDEIDYTARRHRVRVTLGDPTFPAGEAGEGDSLANIESIRSGRGSDVLRGGSSFSLFYGGPGNDKLYAGMGDSTMFGEQGNDRLTGGPGADRLNGDEGRDTITGGCGADSLAGGAGNDRIFGADGYRDRVGGGSGTDFAEYDQLDIVRHVERRHAVHVDACAF